MLTGHWKDRPYGDRPSGAAALRAAFTPLAKIKGADHE